jgi:transcriptional regulator with XRE-family HTH domain
MSPSGPAAKASPVQARYRRLLGQNVHRVRGLRGLTQSDLAEATGLSADWISLIEQGRVNPSLDVIVDLAVALKLRPADLVTAPDDSSGR